MPHDVSLAPILVQQNYTSLPPLDPAAVQWGEAAALAFEARARALDAANDEPADFEVRRLLGSAHLAADALLAYMESPDAYAAAGVVSAEHALRAACGAVEACGRAATIAAARAHRLPFPPQTATPPVEALATAAALQLARPSLPAAPRPGRMLEALEAHAARCMESTAAPLAVLLRAQRWTGDHATVGTESIYKFLARVRFYVLFRHAGWPVSERSAGFPRAIASAALRALGHDPRRFSAATRQHRARATKARLRLAKDALAARAPARSTPAR